MSDIKNFERNKYFYGKLMTVRDFETEQSYFIEKQRLINRLIHGAGVVCGLKVEKADEGLDTTRIRIYPGVAIDCCGREIIVPEAKVVDLKDSLEGTNKVYVLLKYDFCEKESVPVINNVSACEETCCYNRILETYKIEISKEPPDDCTLADKELCNAWPAAENPVVFIDYWIEKGCAKCPQEPAVLLAAITVQNSTIKEIDNAIKDDDEGIKKRLVFSNAHLYELIKCVEKQPGPHGLPGDPGPGLEEGLTFITMIKPEFEEVVTLGDFLGTGIKVSFSSEIESGTVNKDTFQVAVYTPRLHQIGVEPAAARLAADIRPTVLTRHYEYIDGNITPSNGDNIFTFKPGTPEELITPLINLEHNHKGKLKILVQIKCDFIKDMKGKAVAGHNLFGQGESGLNINGSYNIQGGIFETWFWLTSTTYPYGYGVSYTGIGGDNV